MTARLRRMSSPIREDRSFAARRARSTDLRACPAARGVGNSRAWAPDALFGKAPSCCSRRIRGRRRAGRARLDHVMAKEQNTGERAGRVGRSRCGSCFRDEVRLSIQIACARTVAPALAYEWTNEWAKARRESHRLNGRVRSPHADYDAKTQSLTLPFSVGYDRYPWII